MLPDQTCCLNRFLEVQFGWQIRLVKRGQLLLDLNYFAFLCQLTPPVRYNRGRLAADLAVSFFVHA